MQSPHILTGYLISQFPTAKKQAFLQILRLRTVYRFNPNTNLNNYENQQYLHMFNK